MWIPNKKKFRKYRKGNLVGCEYKSINLVFGTSGLKSLENGRITTKQIETARQVIRRKIRPFGGKLWIRIFPHLSITSKPAEVRMGKGKGSINTWVAHVKRGQVLFEIAGVPSKAAKAILLGGGQKLPVLVKTILKK
jgi:large subunit ribosomal protein L16|tara:strand:- start:6 stop:416 length:411 start_codon:yes stop_codon:yes gene_type:complete